MDRIATSFCRNCPSLCAVQLQISGNQVTKIAGDRSSPVSRGYCCVKAEASRERQNGARRLESSLKRHKEEYRPITSDLAIAEIAQKVNDLIARWGPRSVGVYYGTGAFYSATAMTFTKSWAKSIETPHIYSSQTIDQSPKVVRALRMGNFKSGKQPFATSDAWVLSGSNPLVSHIGGFGAFTMYNPGLDIRQAKRRGLKLVVIDPRRTETADLADLHLQPKPGQDVAIHAAMLNIISAQGWHDKEFCERYTVNFDLLLKSIARYTPEYAAREAGIEVSDLWKAARIFGTARTGCATSGTGSNMSPHANLSEHLLECLNVICGRYRRAGDQVLNQSVLTDVPVCEGVDAACPIWDLSPRMASHPDIGFAVPDEFPINLLADEIMHKGDDRLRALISVAGNPVSGIPDQLAVADAFRNLELLVSLDFQMSETAALSHYVINCKQPYERPDIALLTDGNSPFAAAQYTDAVIEAPEGTIEEWEFFYELSRRMGIELKWNFTLFFGPPSNETMTFDTKPSSDALFDFICKNREFPFSSLKAAGGAVSPQLTPKYVQPADPNNKAKLDLMPAEVLSEFNESYSTHQRQQVGEGELLLHVRRRLEVMNSIYQDSGTAVRRTPYNPLYMHPSDMDSRRISAGDRVSVTTTHGSLLVTAKADVTQRPGAVAIHHGWITDGSSTATVNVLIDKDGLREAHNMTPRMSAIPVKIERLAG